MKKRGKKRFAFVFLIVLSFLVSYLFIPSSAYSSDKEPSRVINIVYDDSGSMISDNSGNKCDTWCQAKYAMEVFAAMLGDNDKMNVYVMSDFQKADSAPPIISISGTSSDADNVSRIHQMLTKAANYTTFTTVEKAYADLQGESADEKWLIVLTDGEFNKPQKNARDIENFFAAKDPDIKVMFCGMGPKACVISPNEANNVFFVKAETSADILEKITGICNRIFNTNKLNVDISSKTFDFDVPMSELVIFAQGEGVAFNNLMDSSGNALDGKSATVDVSYSEKASTDETGKYADPVIDTNLVGTIANYKGLYDIGKYTVDAPNAQTIEVYYKPAVEIMAFLVDEAGNEVDVGSTIEPGDYTLQLAFVKPRTTEKIEKSQLLGDVTFSAYLSGEGTDPDRVYVPGDTISLGKGVYDIQAIAEIPKFYTSVTTELPLGTFKHRAINLVEDSNSPEYIIDKELFKKDGLDGFTNAEIPTVVHIGLDGEQITKEEWDMLPEPTLIQNEEFGTCDDRIGFTIEKSDMVGEIVIHPYLVDGKTDMKDDYRNVDVLISYELQGDGEAWIGELSHTVRITDNRFLRPSTVRRIVLAFCGIVLLFLILLYMPFVKKYLPKKLKSQPVITCKPNKPGKKPYERKGKFTKNRLSTIIPLIPETGTIKFTPSGVAGAPAIRVKAVESGRRMEVTNTSAFSNNKNVSFNGNKVDPASKKNITLTASANIEFKDATTTYSCTLNH